MLSSTRYSFAYDANGLLSAVTDADNNISTITRDSKGKPSAIVAPFGQKTDLTVDDEGYLASISDPAGDQTTLTYHPGTGLLKTLVTPRKYTHSFDFDVSTGRLISDANPAGGNKTLGISADTPTATTSGFTVTLATAGGQSTTHHVTKVDKGDETHTTTLRTGATTGIASTLAMHPDGSVTTTSADGTIGVTKTSGDSRFGMQSPVPSQTTVTTPSGLQAVVKASRSTTLSNPDDVLSLTTLTQTVQLNSHPLATATFNVASRTLTATSAGGRTRTTKVDSTGRPLTTTVPGLLPLQMTYSSSGTLATVTQGTRQTQFTYDATTNFLNSVTDPLGHTTLLGHDAVGRVTMVTTPRNAVASFGPDLSGNLSSVNPPGQPEHKFTYTAVDLVQDYTPPALAPDAGATATTYAYNLDGLLTSVSRPDGTAVNTPRDADAGAEWITKVELPSGHGTITPTYDHTTGKLKSLAGPMNVTLDYSYDGPLVTDKTWTGPVAGTLHWDYNNDFRVSSETVNGTGAVAFSYDKDGILIQAGPLTLTPDTSNGMLTGTTVGSATDSVQYDTYGAPSQYTATVSGTAIWSVSPTPDAIGRIASLTETVNVPGGSTSAHGYTYQYDADGHLTDVLLQDGSAYHHYGYDENGNRTEFTAAGQATINPTYDAQDRLKTYGSLSFTYTSSGELESKTDSSPGGGTSSYDYDELGNLRGVTLPDQTTIGYVIDGAGHRVQKTKNGAATMGLLWSGALRVAAQLDSNGNVVSRFVYGTRVNVPDVMIQGTNTYRIFTDFRGSVRLVVNAATGAVVQEMDYDEFGNVLNDTNPGFQPFGFGGGLWDADTGLVRFGAREDTRFDPTNCGGCGVACNPGDMCSNGVCGQFCTGGTMACGKTCVDTRFDPANCGVCGNACPSGRVCSNGACNAVCAGSATQCGGVCVDARFDPTNCGGCGVACNPGDMCSNGVCGQFCTGGTTACGKTCVDTRFDPANCGVCGNACPSGRVCSNGACNPVCAGSSTECGGVCVDTRFDPTNCGACGVACNPGDVCSNGVCGQFCTGGTTACGSRCVDISSDPANCGVCGHACDATSSCVHGACALGCSGTDCNGRCTDTSIDPNNCGSCGHVCDSGEICKSGVCETSCTGGTTLCAGVCRDTMLDPNHCGACGTKCAAGQLCSAGTCGIACLGGTTLCSGTCADTKNDPSNCGTCGNQCPSGQLCSGGTCTRCPSGRLLCGSTCVDPQSDINNCGRCGSYCYASDGTATCTAGVCGANCWTGYATCGTSTYACQTDLSRDPLNCGSCTNACAANQRCVSGVCTPCPAGMTLCSGSCVDTQSDSYNCGICRNYCYGIGINQAASCVAGVCVPKCYAGYLDCNGVSSDGCEVTASTDQRNCGACGNACLANQICSAGSCSTCTGGTSVCGNTCVSLTGDPNNCGACGRTCAALANATATCTASACSFACRTGYLDCDGNALTGCESSARSVASCGTCGTTCSAGQVCTKSMTCAACPAMTLSGTLPFTVSGTTAGRPDQFDTACSSSGAPDVAYSFTAPTTRTYTFDTAGTTFYTAIEVRDGDCSGTSLGCNYGYGGGTTLYMPLTAGQAVTVVIDGTSSSQQGAYTLTVR